MLKRLIRAIQYFFTLSRSEQRGIIALVILILLATAGFFTLPFFFHTDKQDFQAFEQEIDSFRQEQQTTQDSIRIIRLQNAGEMDHELALRKIKPFPFNPNKLPVEAWQALGLSDRQIKSIKNYEANGGHFYRKTDVKKMYAISEIEYEILEPYIQIKSQFIAGDEKLPGERYGKSYLSQLEINRADSTQIVKRLHLSPWLAARVIKYRNLLGGFYQKQQLAEVYGFDSIAVVKKKKRFRVDATRIHKLNLNHATFKELLRHPYISYKLTQYIVNTRKTKGEFKSIEEIQKSPLVSESLFYKLKPYLSVGE